MLTLILGEIWTGDILNLFLRVFDELASVPLSCPFCFSSQIVAACNAANLTYNIATRSNSIGQLDKASFPSMDLFSDSILWKYFHSYFLYAGIHFNWQLKVIWPFSTNRKIGADVLLNNFLFGWVLVPSAIRTSLKIWRLPKAGARMFRQLTGSATQGSQLDCPLQALGHCEHSSSG